MGPKSIAVCCSYVRGCPAATLWWGHRVHAAFRPVSGECPRQGGGSVRKRLFIMVAGAALAAALVGPIASAGASYGKIVLPRGRTGVKGLAQANPGARPITTHPGYTPTGSPSAGPTIGSNRQGALYHRDGTLIKSASLQTLTGHNQFSLSDPMALFDPPTDRFYYNVWDVGQSTMAWGFSKTDNPQQIPGDFCNYTNSFGYTTSEFPDYPKLGQSRDFLMIGVNHYPSLSTLHADRSDLLWINKPTQLGPVTTCPPATTFKSGIFKDVRNDDGTQAWTPVPAIEVDHSKYGYVMTSSDIECPDICGTGNKITVHLLRPTPGNRKVPEFFTTGHSVTVPTFAPPATNGPQKGTSNTISTLDGRLEHAVAAIDPAVGKIVVYTGHNVNSTANRSEFRWYEILPTPFGSPTLVQSGTIKDSSLYVLNGAISSDRTCQKAGCAHGDSLVAGFTTTSSTTYPAVQMASKIGSGAMSAFVMVHAATTFDADFTCTPNCRWGDYGGATPDPAQSLTAAHGEVWLTQDATN